MLPVGPKFFDSPLYMREDPYWDKVVLAMHMDGDPYWANTVLSMPMDGADNGTTFTDLKGKTVTPVGNTVTRTINKAFGTASAYFDGTGDALSTPTSADFDFGSGDFTVELWWCPTAAPKLWAGSYWSSLVARDQVGTGRQFWLRGYASPGSSTYNVLQLAVSPDNSTFYDVTASVDVQMNRWYHVAVQRRGTQLELYHNGWLTQATTIPSISLTSPGIPLIIGRDGNSSGDFTGYIDGLRITKGVARYTNHFELSTSPFPIGTTIVDEKGHAITVGGNTVLSSTQSAFGGYSAYFDGSGDYLSLADSDEWHFGAGDFTIECRVRLNTVHGAYHFLMGQWNGPGLYGWEVVANTNAFILGYTADGSTDSYVSSAPTLSLNTWYHLAVSRRGNTIYLFVDGIVKQAATVTVALANVGAQLYIGMNQNGGAWASNIYMDDLRITKGVGRYISNFTPPNRFPSHTPTDPYYSSVVLRMPFNGAHGSTAITDEKGKAVTVVGNTQLSATQARFGPTACYFDGNGDYLSVSASTDFNLAAGNFTIEFWLYVPSNPTSTNMVIGTWDGTSTLNWGVFVGINNTIGFSCSTSGSYQPANDYYVNGIVVAGTWQHCVLTRNGNTLTGYANGVSFGTKDMTGITIIHSGAVLKLGGNTNNQWFNGYIDDVRVTKGVARYTANFTPPRAPFPNW